MNPLKIILFYALLVGVSLCHAFHIHDTQKDDKKIKALLKETSHQSLKSRISYFSKQFLHKPYLLYALGEGPQGAFNQMPLYRTDAFDCETFVDTVLALAYAEDISSFKKHINQIRYANGKPDFLTRNHFTNIDWNQNNRSKGYLKDITSNIYEKNHPLYQKETTLINKKNWYKNLNEAVIQLKISSIEKKQKIQQLRTLGARRLSNAKSKIAFIPLSAFFNKNNQIKPEILKQIPHGAIIQIVRPHWNLEDKIGTKLDISHLGFAIWKENQLYFRNASSIHHRVVDEPLHKYLQKALKSPTIKGIHIEEPKDLSS